MFRNMFGRKPKEKTAEPETTTPEASRSPEPDAPAVVSADAPEGRREGKGLLGWLRKGLAKTRATLTGRLTDLLRMGRTIDEDLLEEMEEVLIQADVGVNATMHLLERIRAVVRERGLKDASDLRGILAEEVLVILGDDPGPLDLERDGLSVLLVVGVNGVGKTTTIGKLASQYRGDGKRVLVAAGDTFRAAAIDQLEVWCQRAGVELIRQAEGSDAAAVVFDAICAARARKADILIIDTAGRLHTKKNLMDELGKIRRVVAREVPGAPHEVLLVIDATTGQNAVQQAKQFGEIAQVTALAVTKLDSSAKGGMVIAVRHETGIPVKLVGLGEGIEDLRAFAPNAFTDALLSDNE